MGTAAIVFGSFLLSLYTVVRCPKPAGWKANWPVGPANWDFAKSWGTNVAIFGSLIGTFFQNQIVANPVFVPVPGYPLLSVLFALLALVAPAAFLALSQVNPVKNKGALEIQSQGSARGFLVAMLLTLWAALGQLATLGALTFEVMNSGKSSVATVVLAIILSAAAVTVVAYAWRTAKPLLMHQKAASDLVAVAGATDDTALPAWSLL
ncbi:MAG: hypothetical protein AUG06_10935 [Actinobacteria bacterium 13_1_20CM_2_65_11]|nr:MAG: hypothetical protein AUH69_08935 [Actinobacteria bacterium 13_1_40CM_4_65_12]OLD25557.1 MAG: hypothetical protein AUJ02_04950 [Chloroflexi bacterium 13_1_40CM_3_65_12]OLE78357.1 MAG: hypothetical protein AUG06_10935 [Actinobacteria bacterium 13_1_20CM_2_65_11]